MNENYEVYSHPKYYEIAFLFRDIEREVDILEKCIALYSRIPVHRVLEVGCGPAPHAADLSKKGYQYIGLDLNKQMLDYARSKAQTIGFSPTFIHADMTRFSMPESVDFAFILLGSLYAENTEELMSHFMSVAKALKSGGLYLLDWCVEFDALTNKADSWVTERDRCKIETSYARKIIDPVAQTFEEVITLHVRDREDPECTLEERHVKRAIFPQEFLLLVEKTQEFEFIGWWNNWNLQKPLQVRALPKAEVKIERPIALIRKL